MPLRWSWKSKRRTRAFALLCYDTADRKPLPSIGIKVELVQTQDYNKGTSIDKEAFELFAEGDTDTVNLKLPKDMLVELSSPGKFKSLFSIDYFSNMIKPVKAGDPITIFLGNDNPIRVDFDIAEKKGHVTYLLAPRIESE